MTGSERAAVSIVPRRRTTRFDDEETLEDLLSLLNDRDCRAIIEETSQTALSAQEIAERCEIPQSTTYRKIKLLEDHKILEERTRLKRLGQYLNEYRLRVEEFKLTVTPQQGIELSLTWETDERDPTV